MRTGTPFRTSSTMADCGQSATSQVNSSPRMIGPGMHQHGVFLGQLQPRHGHLVARNVILQADLRPGQTFLLHPQDHDHISAVDRFFDGTRDVQAGRQRGREFRAEIPAARTE